MRKEFFMACALVLLPTSCGVPPPVAGSQMPGTTRRSSSSAYCLTSQCLYVLNAYDPAAVNIYRTDQHGPAKPIETISGAVTGLQSPDAVAVDANHNVYVAGSNYQYESFVTVYSAGDYGNIAPTQTIEGPDTQMGMVTGIAIDSARNIYVTNYFGGTPCVGSVTVYAAGANGDAAPIAQIEGVKTHLCDPAGIAIDSSGNLYVTSGQQYSSAVNVYAAGSNGNVRPMAVISGNRTLLYDPAGITLDAAGNIYVVGGELMKFKAGAHGNAKPQQAIAGILTKLEFPYGIAVNSKDEIYVNNTVRKDVVVFASQATGDVPPIRIIRKDRRSIRRLTNIAIR